MTLGSGLIMMITQYGKLSRWLRAGCFEPLLLEGSPGAFTALPKAVPSRPGSGGHTSSRRASHLVGEAF